MNEKIIALTSDHHIRNSVPSFGSYMKNTPSFLQYVECYAIFLEGMTSRMSTCIYTCNTAAHTYIFIIVVLPTATLFYIVLADL